MTAIVVQPEEMSPRRVLRVLHLHLKLVVSCVCVCLGLAVYYLVRTPSVYESSATLKLLERGDSAHALLKEDAEQGGGAPKSMQTDLEVVRSAYVAGSVMKAMNFLARPEYAHSTEDQVVSDLQKMVQVKAAKDSSLMVISAQAGDPQLAADLANQWARSFMDSSLELKRRSARQQGSFISAELQKYRKNFEASGSAPAPPPEAKGDPLADMKTRVSALEVERAALSSRYSREYPRLKEVEAQLAELRSQLKDETVHLPTHKARVDESVYSMLLQKQEEARISESVDDSGILVIDRAAPSKVPVKPDRRQVLVLGAVFGLLLGSGLAFASDYFKDSIGSEEDLSMLSGSHCLGIIPDFKAEKIRSARTHRFKNNTLITNEYFFNSFYRESFKILRTALAFKNGDGALKTLAVLSPNASEGKTLVNANLAISLALSGRRVLLVDADMRKPSLHRIFHYRPHARQGLPLLLTGQGDLKKMIQATDTENLYLLLNGFSASNPAELIGSHRMETLIHELKGEYDYVIFDCAPVLPVTDSVVLSQKLSGVFLLARAYVTGKTDVRRAATSLRTVQANLLGTVLNGVNLRKSGYGYAYKHYHQDSPPPKA